MIYKVPTLEKPYFIGCLAEHVEIKDDILLGIEKIPNSPYLRNHGAKISKCDFELDRNFPRSYLGKFNKFIYEYMNLLTTTAGFQSWKIHNIWFQQYNTNDFHDWHTHIDCQFANVYYVEYDTNSAVTEIIHPITNNIIQIEAKEGDIITFPSYIKHRAPPLLDKKRKTILSFNSCFLT